MICPRDEELSRSVRCLQPAPAQDSETHLSYSNSATSATMMSALHAASDGFTAGPASSARNLSSSGNHAAGDYYEYQMYGSRSMEQVDSTPATWSAWINEERRQYDVVEPTHASNHAFSGPMMSSHAMPPHFLDPRMCELDEFTSRLPHGLLGGLLDSDASNTTSRSTASRRARLGTEGSAPNMPGMDLFRHEESQNLSRLKTLLGQCAQDTGSIAKALVQSGLPCTLPGLTKLISKFNKSDQWCRGLAVFHALPAVGLTADATVANAALGSCDRGAAADSAWSIYYLMCERNLEADAISYKALISALCKGGQWQRGVVAFARAVEGGVPIEAATVMVLLFALTRSQQLQLAEALFCTAFGMFANMQPLCSMPWDAPASPLSNHALPFELMSGAGYSADWKCSPGNNPAGGQGHTGDVCSLEGQLTSMGQAAVLPSINLSSRPPSAAGSACLSASVTPSADAAAPFGVPGAESGGLHGSRCGSDSLAGEYSPQTLLARLQDLYKVVSENQISSKPAGAAACNVQQFAAGLHGTCTSRFLPNDVAGAWDYPLGMDGARDGDQQPSLLAALMSWQREHSAGTQTCLMNAASDSSTSVPSCSISRSNSITSLGNASGTNSGCTAPSAFARTACATNSVSPSARSDPSRTENFCRTGPVEPGLFSQTPNSGSSQATGLVPARNTIASLGAISTDPLCAACCNAMLSAYRSATVPQADRAACLLQVLHAAGGALEPDVVAYNAVIQAQAACGNLKCMLETMAALHASGLRPTTATFSALMHAHVQAGASLAVLELWYQMLQARVLPGTVCLRSYTLAAFQCGDTGHIQDARSRYFAHLLTLPPKQAASEACIFLQMHGALGPPNGVQWPPGLSTVELCVTLMRRNGHQGPVQPSYGGHSEMQQLHSRTSQVSNSLHSRTRPSPPPAPQQPQMHTMLAHRQEVSLHELMKTQAQLQAGAHAQGYALAQSHAQLLLQQAGVFASVNGSQAASG